jgi:hypothetical protein
MKKKQIKELIPLVVLFMLFAIVFFSSQGSLTGFATAVFTSGMSADDIAAAANSGFFTSAVMEDEVDLSVGGFYVFESGADTKIKIDNDNNFVVIGNVDEALTVLKDLGDGLVQELDARGGTIEIVHGEVVGTVLDIDALKAELEDMRQLVDDFGELFEYVGSLYKYLDDAGGDVTIEADVDALELEIQTTHDAAVVTYNDAEAVLDAVKTQSDYDGAEAMLADLQVYSRILWEEIERFEDVIVELDEAIYALYDQEITCEEFDWGVAGDGEEHLDECSADETTYFDWYCLDLGHGPEMNERRDTCAFGCDVDKGGCLEETGVCLEYDSGARDADGTEYLNECLYQDTTYTKWACLDYGSGLQLYSQSSSCRYGCDVDKGGCLERDPAIDYGYRCEDTDEGIEPYTYGQTYQDGTLMYSDECHSTTVRDGTGYRVIWKVYDATCDYNDQAKLYQENCEDGDTCEDGVCIPADGEPIVNNEYCEDSDDGYGDEEALFVYGKTTGLDVSDQQIDHVDLCVVGDERTFSNSKYTPAVEWYVEEGRCGVNGRVYAEKKHCPGNGICQDGVCVDESTDWCYDTSWGVSGMQDGDDFAFEQHCVGDIAYSYVCSGDSWEVDWTVCSGGTCSKGVCGEVANDQAFPVACVDNDGIYEAGSASGLSEHNQEVEFDDRCYTSGGVDYIIEAVCEADTGWVAYDQIVCEEGCEKSACVGSEESPVVDESVGTFMNALPSDLIIVMPQSVSLSDSLGILMLSIETGRDVVMEDKYVDGPAIVIGAESELFTVQGDTLIISHGNENLRDVVSQLLQY